MMTRYFILGGGIAALSAAKAIRENDASGLIVMLMNEPALPYYRTALTKQLLHDVTAEELAVERAAWYDAPGRDILVLTGRTVSAIDTQAKTVALEDGLVFPYDRLVYALGARCFMPPFEGHDRANVVAVRNIQDAARVRRLAEKAKTAVVIGGGVLGLEAAWALRQADLSVAVVEYDARVMARQVSADQSEAVARAMKDHDVQLFTCSSVARVDDDGVRLTDGCFIPADLVIVSAGVRANAEIAAAAGIHVDRKILVDSRMRTSAPDVYAAGDCAVCGMSYALWAEAKEMGWVAGVNAAGGSAEYTAVTRPLYFSGFGLKIQA